MPAQMNVTDKQKKDCKIVATAEQKIVAAMAGRSRPDGRGTGHLPFTIVPADSESALYGLDYPTDP